MNILWLVNIPLPEVSKIIGTKPSPYGGWLIRASRELSLIDDIHLSIAFPLHNKKKHICYEGKKITYYPFGQYRGIYSNKKYNITFSRIIHAVKPDLVHIFGTEMNHSLPMAKLCYENGIETVVSMQGIISIIAKHIYSDLPISVIYGKTIRNFIRNDSVKGFKKSFLKRGIYEKKVIRISKNIIGRTKFDYACTTQINPDINYYLCNEVLRDEFYKHKWSIDKCEKFSIFLSQGQYSIKGLHYVLDALPLILNKFSEAKLYIGGKNIIESKTLKDKLLMTYYGKHIKKKIKKNNLEKKVVFTGILNEDKIVNRFLNSHVFVCPSSIENSPNSLGEAMILGVPIVASYVGGIPDMIENNKEGFLYQHNAPYMLAHFVCEIFKNKELAVEFSNNARKHALVTHDTYKNTNQLIYIYKTILDK